jgi:hypothetical protein
MIQWLILKNYSGTRRKKCFKLNYFVPPLERPYMKKIFCLLLISNVLFQSCKKSSDTPPDLYYIRFNIGNSTYLITDTLNIFYAQNLGPYATRGTAGGNTKQMFQINALVQNSSTKDSANAGYYTLITMNCLAGFNLTVDSTVSGTYKNDTSASAKKKSGAGSWMTIYNKSGIHRGEWFVDVNGILPFDITISESNSKYISGSFQGILAKSSFYTSGDSTVAITDGSFKVPYQ